MDFKPLLDAASAALREEIGAVELSDAAVLKESHRSLTVRCRLTSPRPTPRSVIIKQLLADQACGYSDWASLQFLTGIPAARTLAPRFIAGDVASSIFIAEDLGPAETLEDVFNRGDEADILATLTALGAQMARLHALTRERASEFESIRKTLPADEHVGRHREAVNWLRGREKLNAWFAALDYKPPEGFSACLQRIADLYARPGDWLAFSHGDPAPSNNHVLNGQVHLLDFEYGAFRHALYDITAWQMLCPLPYSWLNPMRQAFRGELITAFPCAAEDAEYHRQWAFMCAYRGLAIMSWISPEVLMENRPWAGSWTAREALLCALKRLAAVAEKHPDLADVHYMAVGVLGRLIPRWPEYAGQELTPWKEARCSA